MNRRQYNQNCTLAFALDLLGDRWTLLIIRDLLPGPRKFSHLLSNLVGIGTNLLTTRLKSLQTAGVIERIELPLPYNGKAWALTSIGRELEDITVNLAHWGLKHCLSSYREDNFWSPMWNYVACQARFDPSKSRGVRAIGLMDIGGYIHWIEVNESNFNFGEGHRPDFDFKLCCEKEDFMEFIFENNQPEEFVSNSVTGDIKKFFECMQCFDHEEVLNA